ncbi:MAG: rhodanese-like domain-containing protein [Gammaproteobacteria bacterium]
MSQPAQIHAQELHQRITAGEHCALIDVRTAEEYRALHAEGALLLPLDECTPDALAQCLTDAGHGSDAPIYFICHTGRRATEAAEGVFDRFPQATVVQGGTLAWAQAGLPVKPGSEV